MSISVGLVLVSHSELIARGLGELAGQMAADVTIVPAGGLDDGGIGTSYEKIESAIQSLRSQGLAALVLTDLGSATMTVEAVLETLEDKEVVFADAPFLEGAIAAAVSAQQGSDLWEAASAALGSASIYIDKLDTTPAPESGSEDSNGFFKREAVVADEAGLHARPAAQVAAMAGEYEGEIFINDAEADSIMSIMALGIKQGETVIVSTKDPKCWAGVDKIADAITAGLD
ncbi:dihydroxyacetone kinase phosphoryl donor subunit DhaM [Flaviflexus massiliensis]|uniref:dihydroxyacetone kinase phosphoryl donor subunit DhaM n=1 Tax=Flaviflexus massiliensis TaxID=1522309 RepID=UPI0006D5B650|nr:dihydroxyacetone kinase phosphoryl donor subunit DhaM [Flaviflexus massiliensis]